jgi:hypothetical protein
MGVTAACAVSSDRAPCSSTRSDSPHTCRYYIFLTISTIVSLISLASKRAGPLCRTASKLASHCAYCHAVLCAAP